MRCLLLIGCLFALSRAESSLSSVGSNCDPTLNLYTVTSFVVTPWPPVKNVNLAMRMTGIMNQAQTLKSMEIFVFYKSALFYTESIPESGTYAAGATAIVNFTVFLPSIAPNGNYVVQVKLTNTAGAFLNCWQAAFTL